MALRRPVVGAVASAIFFVTVPFDAYLVLKLDHTRLSLDNVSGVVELPPQVTTLRIGAKTSPPNASPLGERQTTSAIGFDLPLSMPIASSYYHEYLFYSSSRSE